MTLPEIKLALRRSGLTRLQLAERIGCSYTYLCQMLNGFSPLKQEHAEAIKAALKEFSSPE